MAVFYLPKHLPERLSYIFIIAVTMVVIITQFVYYFPNVILTPPVPRGSDTGHKMQNVQLLTADSTSPSSFPAYSLFHLALTLFLLMNLLGNFAQMVRTDSSTAGHVLPNILKPGWRYCSDCIANSPEKSTHCYFCGRCILRQELHCFLTGTCVGLNNLRYYVCVLLYMVLTTAFFTYTNLPHLVERIHADISAPYQVNSGGESVQVTELEYSRLIVFGVTIIMLMFPWLGVVLGVLRFGTAILCLINGLTFTGGLMLLMLFIAQLKRLVRNRAASESQRKINPYRLRGVGENLKQALGSRWYLVWLSPLPWLPFSRLPTDGGITIPYPTASSPLSGTLKDE